LEEKPTQITEVRNPNEIIQELEALGVVKKREAITVTYSTRRRQVQSSPHGWASYLVRRHNGS